MHEPIDDFGGRPIADGFEFEDYGGLEHEDIRLRWRRVVDDVRTAIEANHSSFNVFGKTVLVRGV